MKNYKNVIYALTCLCFTIIIGAGLYEGLVVWQVAFHSPPVSLSMLQGEFGLNGEAFWTGIHPITLLLFIITLALCWKTERKKFILIPFLGYILILIATFLYFVPELDRIAATEYEASINQELVEKGSLWNVLNWLRTGLAIVVAMILYFGLTKSNDKKFGKLNVSQE